DDGARRHALTQGGQAAQRPITVARTALRHSEDSATARLNDVVQSPVDADRAPAARALSTKGMSKITNFV
ncbi:MAG TPA: hypothetical protein VIP75_02775, partial [Acidothermales bacterium]